MKRFVFRVVTLATLLVLVLPFSGMAMDDAPVKPISTPGAGDYDHFIYQCKGQIHSADDTGPSGVHHSQMRLANSFGDSPGIASPWWGRSL